MPQGKMPATDWQAVRERVEAGREPISQIARELGLKPSQIYSRKRRWTKQAISRVVEPCDIPGTIEKPDHASMVGRLYQAAEQQISHMESRLQTGEASFDEKEARMLGTIARTLDKLMELAKSSQQQETEHHEQASDGDIDTLRTDLAKRLELLQSQ